MTVTENHPNAELKVHDASNMKTATDFARGAQQAQQKCNPERRGSVSVRGLRMEGPTNG